MENRQCDRDHGALRRRQQIGGRGLVGLSRWMCAVRDDQRDQFILLPLHECLSNFDQPGSSLCLYAARYRCLLFNL